MEFAEFVADVGIRATVHGRGDVRGGFVVDGEVLRRRGGGKTDEALEEVRDLVVGEAADGGEDVAGGGGGVGGGGGGLGVGARGLGRGGVGVGHGVADMLNIGDGLGGGKVKRCWVLKEERWSGEWRVEGGDGCALL